MLAQNFKTATDLGLDETTYDAAVKVLGMLEREEIPEHLFDMCHVGAPECGTPGCIYGWMRTIHPKLGKISYVPEGLFNLCAPRLVDTGRYNPYRATRQQSASALRNYLTMGEPNWSQVMGA